MKTIGNLFHIGERWWFNFRDFNIRKDMSAAKIDFDSAIPLILTSFELATKVTIMRSDLEKLGSGVHYTLESLPQITPAYPQNRKRLRLLLLRDRLSFRFHRSIHYV